MDLYDENEHVISSDEYSDDDDDDEALMNDAVRAQDFKVRSNDYAYRSKQPKWRTDQKQKQLSSLIRKNKISVIYKNKSIKWLNNKRHRERYKEHIYLNPKKSDMGEIIPIRAPSSEQEKQINTNDKSSNNKKYSMLVQGVVSIEDDEDDFINENNYKKNMEEKEALQKSETLNTLNYNTEGTNIQPEREEAYVEKNLIMKEKILPIEKQLAEKRARSSSPVNVNESSEPIIKNNEKKIRVESPQFYKSVNDMFSKYDKIATNVVETFSSTTLTATKEKMKCLSNEIDTLNEILQSKEMEWNRLLHLKMVKEEIYSRLNQKKHILQLKENYSKKQAQNTLLELKELELFLLEKQPNLSQTNSSAITIQKLIENRANMNADDLEREKNNTSRLHSLLVSRNMLQGADSSDNISALSNGDRVSVAVTSKSSEFNNYFDGGSLISNRGRQGEFKDVKSIIEDFRQKNPEILPRVGKRIKSSEQNNISIPFFEKTSSRTQYFTKDHQSELYPLRNNVEEISITPIGNSKKLSSSHDINFVNTVNNVRLEGNYTKSQVKRDFDGKCSKNMQYPLCQECKTNESRFVCAGCGNQWYCSKKCQISAWDKHSELCTE